MINRVIFGLGNIIYARRILYLYTNAIRVWQLATTHTIQQWGSLTFDLASSDRFKFRVSV
jgi:hypothetical protein